MLEQSRNLGDLIKDTQMKNRRMDEQEADFTKKYTMEAWTRKTDEEVRRT